MRVDEVIAEVRARAAGRTRYAGQEPRYDELLVAEIERLRDGLRQLQLECLGGQLSSSSQQAVVRRLIAETLFGRETERQCAAPAPATTAWRTYAVNLAGKPVFQVDAAAHQELTKLAGRTLWLHSPPVIESEQAPFPPRNDWDRLSPLPHPYRVVTTLRFIVA